ncbi:MAG: hypothetical protein JWN48_819 [Myxococcaceae bacterium]|nr:hypothetical protein [Myxococcaceae bacterium]
MDKKQKPISRRELLQLALASGLISSVGGGFSAPARASELTMRAVEPKDRKLLFILGAWGGASIIDSFMPVSVSDTGDPFGAQAMNVFPDEGLVRPANSAFRVPSVLSDYSIFAKPSFGIADFVQAHGADLAAIGHEVSSVNHTIAQQRSLTGAGINRGRTLMEAMALRYGGGMVLPNCNMAADGYIRHGADPTVPTEARHELISSPLLFATGTHGSRGVAGAPSDALVQRARAARKSLEGASVFGRTFADDARRQKFLNSRETLSPQIEQASVFDKLLLTDPSKIDPKYGVSLDPLALAVRDMLPDIQSDRVQAQVALAFLLAYHGVSTSVTLGFSQDAYVKPDGKIVGSPIAFDFSHNNHRVTQSLMWSRMLGLLDTLITLLKKHDYMGDPSLGKMWDRSLVYVATEFGRDKKRGFLSSSWGTAHDLNNGSIIISPLIKGNAVYGGVDPRTCLTYGFDPSSGVANKDAVMNESDVYGIIAHALDLDAPAARRFPGVVR